MFLTRAERRRRRWRRRLYLFLAALLALIAWAAQQQPGAHGRALVVTCRSTAWSASQAAKAIAVVTRKGGRVAVLAVISDGWPEPATTTRRFRLLEPQVGAVIRVPFVPALRTADDPDQVPLPRRARRALMKIQAATGRTYPISPHQEA